MVTLRDFGRKELWQCLGWCHITVPVDEALDPDLPGQMLFVADNCLRLNGVSHPKGTLNGSDFFFGLVSLK